MTITGELKSQVDSIWDDFWSGGISNPLEVMEQITYLLFIKGLDEWHTLAENQANRTKTPIENPVFGDDQNNLRWSVFKNTDAPTMFKTVDKEVFPFLQERSADSSHAKHMADARLTIPTAALLQKAVDKIDKLPIKDRDTKGDVYEYMLSKIASAGQNGQFRTPRHIIELMVELMAPKPDDTVCDPACGTGGFLVAASEYVRERHSEALLRDESNKHFHNDAFSGFDFDSTMLRIGSMNLQSHGIDNPSITYRDALAEPKTDDEDDPFKDNPLLAEAFSLILANPPFAGSLDYEGTAKDLLQVVKTKKTELLFLALFLRLLKPGGRAAVIVPDGVLFGSTKAHKELRRILVEDQKLDGVISLPSGVFKPYAGVSTAILLFTKTNSGGTDNVWFYDLQADGFSLDDKRTPLLDDDKLGMASSWAELEPDDHAKNNLPDVLVRWGQRRDSELERERTDQSFCVPKAEIVDNDYDLSINRYKEIVYEEIEYQDPQEILDELTVLETEIMDGIESLKDLLK